jgi:hypothetical protein
MSVLGASLVGLVFKPVVILVSFAGLLLPRVGSALSRLLAVARTGVGFVRQKGNWWSYPILILVAAYCVVALVPDTHVDTYTYHLAIPQQFLRVHKFTPEGTSLAHHFPLAGELAYSVAVSLGLDALPHLLQMVSVLASVAVLAAWAGGQGGLTAEALTWILCPTFVWVARLAVVAKNDLLTACYPMVGALLLFRDWPLIPWRSVIISAVVFGCGAGMKLNGLALLVVAAALLGIARAGSRKVAVWMLTALTVFVAWPLKTWLMMGDPFWPMLSDHLSGALWDGESGQAVRIMQGAHMTLGGFGSEAWTGLMQNQPALCLLFPAILFALWKGKAERFLLLDVLFGAVALAIAIPSQWFRLSLPLFLLAIAIGSVGLGRALGSSPSWLRTVTLVTASLSAWIPAGYFVHEWTNPIASVRYLVGVVPADAWLAERRSTLAELEKDLSRVPHLGKVLGIGDVRFYRIPGRSVIERCYGRSWPWVLAREAATTGEIVKRLHQMGCDYIVYNFVTEGYPQPFVIPFLWDDRALGLWRAFVCRDLEIVVQPRHVDVQNGGFCVYRLRRQPSQSKCDYLPYLPGIASLYHQIVSQGKAEDWLAAGLALDKRVPGVAYIRDRIGLAYRLFGAWEKVYEYYSYGVRHGMIDNGNYWQAGGAAMFLGKYPEAIALVERAMIIQPELRPEGEQAIANMRQLLKH